MKGKEGKRVVGWGMQGIKGKGERGTKEMEGGRELR